MGNAASSNRKTYASCGLRDLIGTPLPLWGLPLRPLFLLLYEVEQILQSPETSIDIRAVW